MKTFLEFKNEICMQLDKVRDFAKEIGYQESEKNIQKIKNELEKKKMVVLVCGEIKRGKSSLLSALLEEKGIFPVDVNVATNTVTIVRYGPVEKIEVVFENADKYEVKKISRSEIGEYVTELGNEKNSKKVKCLNIELPNKKLGDGLVFVDTPGVGSLNLEHSEITYGYLPNANILLFVSDALSPLTEPELKFMRSAVKHCKNIIFPLTKIDKTSNYKDILNDNIDKVSKYTSLPKEGIKIVPVSSLAKLKYLENRNVMMLKNSNYQALEKEIWRMIYDRRGEALLVPVLKELLKEISSMESNLKIKYLSLSQDSKTSQELEKQLKKTMEEKQKLLEEGADWRGQLSHDLSIAGSEIVMDIKEWQFEMEDEIGDYIKRIKIPKDLDSITPTVNGMLGDITLKARDEITDRVDDIIEKVMERLGLSIGASGKALEGLSVEFDKIDIDFKTQKKSDKLITVGRHVSMKAAGGAAISGIAAGVIGGAVGFFLGGPAGALILGQYTAGIGGLVGGGAASIKGLVDGIKDSGTADIQRITQVCNKYANRKTQEIINMTNMTIKSLIFELTNELNNKIKSQRAVLDTNIADIQESLKLNKAEAVKSAASMKTFFERVNNIDSDASELLEEIIKTRVIYGGSPIKTDSDINDEKKDMTDAQAGDNKPYKTVAGSEDNKADKAEGSGKVKLDFLEE